jgi:hypothetical protein
MYITRWWAPTSSYEGRTFISRSLSRLYRWETGQCVVDQPHAKGDQTNHVKCFHTVSTGCYNKRTCCRVTSWHCQDISTDELTMPTNFQAAAVRSFPSNCMLASLHNMEGSSGLGGRHGLDRAFVFPLPETEIHCMRLASRPQQLSSEIWCMDHR